MSTYITIGDREKRRPKEKEMGMNYAKLCATATFRGEKQVTKDDYIYRGATYTMQGTTGIRKTSSHIAGEW